MRNIIICPIHVGAVSKQKAHGGTSLMPAWVVIGETTVASSYHKGRNSAGSSAIDARSMLEEKSDDAGIAPDSGGVHGRPRDTMARIMYVPPTPENFANDLF